MKPAKPYLFGFWMLLLIITIRLLAVAIAWILMQRMAGSGVSPRRLSSWYSTFSIVLVVIEATIYWYFRYKILNKLWVHIHVWSLFLAMILIPLVVAVMTPTLVGLHSETEYFEDSLLYKIMIVRNYVYWSLLAFGHLFFIVTIVRSLQLKEPESNDSPGLLDEFVNRT